MADRVVMYRIGADDQITPVFAKLEAGHQAATAGIQKLNNQMLGFAGWMQKSVEPIKKIANTASSGASQIASDISDIPDTTKSATDRLQDNLADATRTPRSWLHFRQQFLRFPGQVSFSKLTDKSRIAVDKIVSGFKTIPGHTRQVFNKVDDQITRLNNKINQIPKKIGGAWTRVRNILGDYGAFMSVERATTAMVDIFKLSTGLARDLNETMNKSKVVFGEYTAQIEQFGLKADKIAGLSKNAAMGQAAAFGSMFKELGFGGKQLADLSEGAVRLASDLASFNNLDPQQSFEALFSGVKGETEVLASNFGIVLDEMMVKKKALEMGLVTPKQAKGTLSKEIKVIATYQAILDKTKDAQGDFAKTSLDAANAERILQASVENRMATLGKMFLPIYNKVLNKLIEFTDWVSRNETQIKRWSVIGLKVGGIILGIVTAINMYKKAITVAKFATAAFNFVASMNPFGWVVLAVAAVVGAIVLIVRNWDNLKGYMIKWGTWALKWALKLNPITWILKFWNWVLGLLDSVFPGIKDRLAGLLSWVGDLFMKYAKFLWKISPWRLLLDGLDYIFPGLKEKLTKVFDWIIDKILQFINWFKKSALGQIISNVFNLKWDAKVPGTPKNTKEKKGKKPKTEKESDPFSFGGVSNILSGKPGVEDSKKGDLGGAVNDKLSGSVSGGGGIKNITINIDKLIEKFIIETNNLGMNEGQVKSMVTRTLLSAVNDVNYGG